MNDTDSRKAAETLVNANRGRPPRPRTRPRARLPSRSPDWPAHTLCDKPACGLPGRVSRPFKAHPRKGSVLASLCACVLGLSSVHVIAADGKPIYRSTDSNGIVSFTDRPQHDAVVVEPGQISVIGPERPAARAATSPGSRNPTGIESDELESVEADFTGEEEFADEPVGDAPPGVLIDTVVIASPPPDAHLLDASGPLLVEVGTSPGSLSDSGLIAEVLVDDTVVSSGTGSQVPVSGLDRGEHQLRVRLVDVDGSVVVESPPQPLHVRRSSAKKTE